MNFRALVLALFLVAVGAHADVWERNDAGELTLHRMLDYSQRARLSNAWQPLSSAALARKRTEYDPLVSELAEASGVDARLVHAVIEVESAYDPQAVSKTGAMGLMQLMPATAERFAVRDALDATENVAAGVRYLKVLTDEFQDLELVLAAYNAGEEAVRRYQNQVPPYPETRAYVDRVLLLLRKELGGDGR